MVAPKGVGPTTVVVDDTLDAELLEDPVRNECATGEANNVDDEAEIDGLNGQDDEDDGSGNDAVSSDVEMQDMSEQVLDSVADLFE